MPIHSRRPRLAAVETNEQLKQRLAQEKRANAKVSAETNLRKLSRSAHIIERVMNGGADAQARNQKVISTIKASFEEYRDNLLSQALDLGMDAELPVGDATGEAIIVINNASEIATLVGGDLAHPDYTRLTHEAIEQLRTSTPARLSVTQSLYLHQLVVMNDIASEINALNTGSFNHERILALLKFITDYDKTNKFVVEVGALDPDAFRVFQLGNHIAYAGFTQRWWQELVVANDLEGGLQWLLDLTLDAIKPSENGNAHSDDSAGKLSNDAQKNLYKWFGGGQWAKDFIKKASRDLLPVFLGIKANGGELNSLRVTICELLTLEKYDKLGRPGYKLNVRFFEPYINACFPNPADSDEKAKMRQNIAEYIAYARRLQNGRDFPASHPVYPFLATEVVKIDDAEVEQEYNLKQRRQELIGVIDLVRSQLVEAFAELRILNRDEQKVFEDFMLAVCPATLHSLLVQFESLDNDVVPHELKTLVRSFVEDEKTVDAIVTALSKAVVRKAVFVDNPRLDALNNVLKRTREQLRDNDRKIVEYFDTVDDWVRSLLRTSDDDGFMLGIGADMSIQYSKLINPTSTALSKYMPSDPATRLRYIHELRTAIDEIDVALGRFNEIGLSDRKEDIMLLDAKGRLEKTKKELVKKRRDFEKASLAYSLKSLRALVDVQIDDSDDLNRKLRRENKIREIERLQRLEEREKLAKPFINTMDRLLVEIESDSYTVWSEDEIEQFLGSSQVSRDEFDRWSEKKKADLKIAIKINRVQILAQTLSRLDSTFSLDGKIAELGRIQLFYQSSSSIILEHLVPAQQLDITRPQPDYGNDSGGWLPWVHDWGQYLLDRFTILKTIVTTVLWIAESIIYIFTWPFAELFKFINGKRAVNADLVAEIDGLSQEITSYKLALQRKIEEIKTTARNNNRDLIPDETAQINQLTDCVVVLTELQDELVGNSNRQRTEGEEKTQGIRDRVGRFGYVNHDLWDGETGSLHACRDKFYLLQFCLELKEELKSIAERGGTDVQSEGSLELFTEDEQLKLAKLEEKLKSLQLAIKRSDSRTSLAQHRGRLESFELDINGFNSDCEKAALQRIQERRATMVSQAEEALALAAGVSVIDGADGSLLELPELSDEQAALYDQDFVVAVKAASPGAVEPGVDVTSQSTDGSRSITGEPSSSHAGATSSDMSEHQAADCDVLIKQLRDLQAGRVVTEGHDAPTALRHAANRHYLENLEQAIDIRRVRVLAQVPPAVIPQGTSSSDAAKIRNERNEFIARIKDQCDVIQAKIETVKAQVESYSTQDELSIYGPAKIDAKALIDAGLHEFDKLEIMVRRQVKYGSTAQRLPAAAVELLNVICSDAVIRKAISSSMTAATAAIVSPSGGVGVAATAGYDAFMGVLKEDVASSRRTVNLEAVEGVEATDTSSLVVVPAVSPEPTNTQAVSLLLERIVANAKQNPAIKAALSVAADTGADALREKKALSEAFAIAFSEGIRQLVEGDRIGASSEEKTQAQGSLGLIVGLTTRYSGPVGSAIVAALEAGRNGSTQNPEAVAMEVLLREISNLRQSEGGQGVVVSVFDAAAVGAQTVVHAQNRGWGSAVATAAGAAHAGDAFIAQAPLTRGIAGGLAVAAGGVVTGTAMAIDGVTHTVVNGVKGTWGMASAAASAVRRAGVVGTLGALTLGMMASAAPQPAIVFTPDVRFEDTENTQPAGADDAEVDTHAPQSPRAAVSSRAEDLFASPLASAVVAPKDGLDSRASSVSSTISGVLRDAQYAQPALHLPPLPLQERDRKSMYSSDDSIGSGLTDMAITAGRANVGTPSLRQSGLGSSTDGSNPSSSPRDIELGSQSPVVAENSITTAPKGKGRLGLLWRWAGATPAVEPEPVAYDARTSREFVVGPAQ